MQQRPPRSKRGQLKIFLSATPGMGKTHAMLQAALAQREQGVDLCVGVVASHGQAEVEALLVSLSQQPLQRPLADAPMEMDLDALLARRPELVLIDELAHDNAPGSRHSKRWQDVHELLDAGIDVYSTLSVLHLESLNDRIHDLTGVRVQETLPDWVVHEAAEILLIDLPYSELLARLSAGKVYVGEHARATVDAFFTQRNLMALRELAMQTVAIHLDRALGRQSDDGPSVHGRLLVGIDGERNAERLIRHACQVAERRGLPWSAVYVENGRLRSERHIVNLQHAQKLVAQLGGEVVILRGQSVADTLLAHARERRANIILVARSRPRWQRAWLGRGLGERLLRNSDGLEISVLDTRSRDVPAESRRAFIAPVRDYLLALLATAVALLVALGLSHLVELPNISLLFLMAVLVVAVRSSIGPALLCAVLSFLLYNVVFIEPYMSLKIERHEDLLTLLFFLLMASLTGNLASRQRRQLKALQVAQAESTALLDLSQRLAAAPDYQSVLQAAEQPFRRWPELEVQLFYRDSEDAWVGASGEHGLLNESEQATALWVWEHNQPAGAGSDTLADGRWWWYPLANEGVSLALLAVRHKEGGVLSPEQRQLLIALASPLALSLARARLVQELESARLHSQSEELRSALLASVSHDLRTPLTVMRGSIDTLLSLDQSITAADRHELLEGTRNEAERLDRYIQNLLDMTRLGHGSLTLQRDWVAPADIVGSAIQRLHSLLEPLQLELRLDADLPLLYVHGALIEQALVNVLENAVRFSPAQGRIELIAEADQQELRLRVLDEGPGIPEDERAHIFDMFYSVARGDRNGQGTGLGLAICQGMVGAHGGHVSVAAGLEGRGASLTLHLPLHPQPDMDEEAAQ